MKLWKPITEVPGPFIEELTGAGYHPIIAEVLYRRGYESLQAVSSFLGRYDEDDNPFRMKGMTEAVYRLRMAIRNQEPIAVYGDFDCDGVTSTTLLTQALSKLGAQVQPYIPDRVDEGYGLNSPALKSLAESGVKVVVSVDCGIRSVQEVLDGNSYGLDIIISDHHSVGPELPPAYAVINPKQLDCLYPEKMLAGVGIAYKIAQAMFMEAQRRGIRQKDGWRPEDFLDLVAIGTVADIAPLKGENRGLVQAGLHHLNNTRRPGLQALYGVAGIRPGGVTSTTIGFVIGPRINAAGRLRSAMLSYDLLNSPDVTSAGKYASQLNDINRERQQKTTLMQEWAEETIEGDISEQMLLFSADSRYEQGIVGLVASRLTESYYRPSVIVHQGEEESHGSCRSIPEFHITHALEHCDDLLERYGGHAAAAGFTVRNENIPYLADRLKEIADDSLSEHVLQPTLNIDAEIPLDTANFSLVQALDTLEPTGEANSPPLFMTRNVVIANRTRIGTDGKHLKLNFTNGGMPVEAIAFRRGDEADNLPDQVDITYYLEVNEWKGNRRLQLNIQDIRSSKEIDA